MGRFQWVKLTVDELPLRQLGKGPLKAYLALISDMDEDGVTTRSFSSIAAQAGLSDRSIYRAIKDLEKLEVVERLSEGKSTSRWRILRGARTGRG